MNIKELNAVGITADDMILTPWDSVEYLKDNESIKGYLNAALEEAPDDIKYMNRVFSNALEAHNILELARKTGIARETIYKITRGVGNPTLSTLSKLTDAMGLQITIVPKKHNKQIVNS